MDFNRLKILTVSLIAVVLCFLLLSFSVHAASRGITVKAKTSNGAVKEIQIYSGYHALVVGCSDYQKGWPRLPNPVKDAREVASMLKSFGWSVDILEDPDGQTLKRELNKLVTGPGKNREEAIFFWFSGHGQTIQEADGTKLGYLVPVDAPDPDKDMLGFMERAVSMRQVETVSKQIMSKHVLMAFDSCFSGAIFQMVRAKPSPYIEEKVSYPVRQFITAGTESEEVPDKSVFKEVFIQGIKDGFADLNRDKYITGEELGSYLQENVVNYSRKAQHPQFGKINNPKLDKGDFIFQLPSSGRVAAAPVKTDGTGLQAERERLEQERKELAKLEAEAAERQRIEAERQEIEARKKQLLATEKEIASDGTMLAYASGVVFDKKTGLEWFAGPDRDTNWNEAKTWVESLNVAGGGWRMPTRAELETLFQYGAGKSNMTPLLKTTGFRVWSGETKDSSSACYFAFYAGYAAWGERGIASYGDRGFAVRSRRQ